jgi:PhoH-like ATPase
MHKAYILDTNVLIEDPDAIDVLRNGVENTIILPYSVLMELDRLKRRQDIAHLIARISEKIDNSGFIKVIKIDGKKYSYESNDSDIIEDIKFANKHREIYFQDCDEQIVVTNDRMFRIKLKYEGISSQEYISSNAFTSESQIYTGFVDENDEQKPSNSFYRDSENKNMLMYHKDSDNVKPIIYDNIVWNVTPRNHYQNAAVELMLDPDINVVTLQSEAGYGKTMLSLACALKLVFEKPKKFDKIFVFKPTIEIGQPQGFLPGDEKSKAAPYMRGIKDLIYKLYRIRPISGIFLDYDGKAKVPYSKLEFNDEKFELMNLSYVRSMNIENAVVIMDESQNNSRHEMRAILTRMGENVKCFILGDTSQVDHPHLNAQNNGLNWVVRKFKGMPNYGHLVLKGTKSRGPITDMVLASKL